MSAWKFGYISMMFLRSACERHSNITCDCKGFGSFPQGGHQELHHPSTRLLLYVVFFASCVASQNFHQDELQSVNRRCSTPGEVNHCCLSMSSSNGNDVEFVEVPGVGVIEMCQDVAFEWIVSCTERLLNQDLFRARCQSRSQQ